MFLQEGREERKDEDNHEAHGDTEKIVEFAGKNAHEGIDRTGYINVENYSISGLYLSISERIHGKTTLMKFSIQPSVSP